MPMPGKQIVGGELYRYGYQGEFAETDSETGKPAFQLRIYDPRIGRWTSPDPYGQYFSPYMAMDNRPNMSVDPTGGCTVGVDCPKEFNWMGQGTFVLDEVSIGGFGGTVNWSTDIGLFDFSTQSKSYWEELYLDQSWRNNILNFNGEKLNFKDANNRELYSTSATSGKGFDMNNPNSQNKQDKGPIPEGTYTLINSQWNEQSKLRQVYNIVRGNGDWGDYNVRLTPLTYKGIRHSFFIHGGYFEGSAGCVDCGSNVGKIFELTRNQKNTILIVKY